MFKTFLWILYWKSNIKVKFKKKEKFGLKTWSKSNSGLLKKIREHDFLNIFFLT